MTARPSSSALLAIWVGVTTWSCAAEQPAAVARVAGSYAEMPGGVRALGQPGDFVLENDQIQLVIQAPGFSRGFGVYGGSLIDAVPATVGAPTLREGVDGFGELFPAFFLQAVAVDDVRIVADGTDGGPAVVEAAGTAADFLELAGLLNRLATSSHTDAANAQSQQNLSYVVRYSLEPGARHVDIEFVVTNISDQTLEMPGELARPLLAALAGTTEEFTVPVGDVALFGAATDVFIPGAGFDVRFGVEGAYEAPVSFPSFPGLIAEYVAARADGVSYLLAAEPSETNYLWRRRDSYASTGAEITQSSLLVPFVASGFLGIFHNSAPPELAPGEQVVVRKIFAVGTGDVGSVLDELYRIRGTETGRVAGRVVDAVSGGPAQDAWVVVYQRDAVSGELRAWAQYDLDAHGRFAGTLQPGLYAARVGGPGRPAGEPVPFEVRVGQTAGLRIAALSPGALRIVVTDDAGAPLPARATLVGTTPLERIGQEPRAFLFDLALGESLRSTDLVADAADPETRRFIEEVAVSHNGEFALRPRPGQYELVISRGPEYSLHRQPVTIEAGRVASARARLERVVDTTGWIAFDPHVHTISSIDSSITHETRAASLAAEGVEWAVITDHNAITDIRPTIDRLGLRPWVGASVGIELTTLESGHFNAYPLQYAVAPVTHGAFEWSNRPPDALFDQLRSLGTHEELGAIVQVNHPRDSIIGYFDEYDRDGRTAEQTPPSSTDRLIAAVTGGGSLAPTGPAFVDSDGNSTFSLNFDAMEILNGKLYWQIHHARMPEIVPPEAELPDDVPAAGAVLLDGDDEVAFAGAVDDWFNLLNLGLRPVGIGSSDSHGLHEEVGYFRSYVASATDSAADLREHDVMQAVAAGRLVATNGPLVTFTVNGEANGIGSEIVDLDGEVELRLRLAAAPWISVARLNVWRNGEVVATLEVDPDRDLASNPLDELIVLSLASGADGEATDSWFVVQALGYRSFFPVVRPLDVPPLNLINAIGALAGPLGFGSDAFGDLVPPQVFPLAAHAITNPIWVKAAEGREFVAPGLLSDATRDLAANDPGFDIHPADGIVPVGAPGPLASEKLLGPGHVHGRAAAVRSLFDLPATSAADIRAIQSLLHCGR